MKNRAAARYLLEGFDQVEGWLSITTAHIMASIAERQVEEKITGDIAEIGIHHGKSAIALTNLLAPGEKLIAIDVFEDQHKNPDQSGAGSRRAFLANMQAYAPKPVEVIQESSLDLPALGWPSRNAGRIRFFSIDGSHTREATLSDLKLAEQTVKPGGVVAVDDILSSHWLGVISGVFDYLAAGGRLVPFAIIPNKLLMASGDPAIWSAFLADRYGKSTSKRGVQFLGHPLDIIEDDPSFLPELKSLLIAA